MNSGWKRLKGSEIISLTLMELLLMLSFVCLVVIKGFYEERQKTNTFFKKLDQVVMKGGANPAADKNNIDKRISEFVIYFDRLPSGWTSLQLPTHGEAALLKIISELEDKIKLLTKGGNPEQLARDKRQLEVINNKLTVERGKMLSALRKADTKAAKGYLDNPPSGEGGAPGKKPCMIDNGNIRAIYSITIGEDEYFVKPIYPKSQQEKVAALPLKINDDGQKFSTSQFRNRMSLICKAGEKNGCTYYAKVSVKDSISVVASNRGINTVNLFFYPLGPIQTVQE